MRFATCLLTLAVLEVVPAQKTLWVRPGSYPTIQAAVQAAAPGDIIRVVPTTGGYQGATINKGLHLLAEGAVSITSKLTIQSVPSGQHVAIKGFRMLLSATHGAPVQCIHCRGTVHLADVQGRGSKTGHALSVTNCAHVSAVDCTFNSGEYVNLIWNRTVYIGPGVSITHSQVSFTRCNLFGLAYASRGSSPGFLGSFEGVVVTGSRLILVDCNVTGGGGQCGPVFTQCGVYQAPKPGIAATGACTIIAKGSSILGANYAFGSCFCWTPKVDDVFADPATRVVRDPGVAFTVRGGQVTVRHVHDLQARGAAPGTAVPVTMRSSVVAPYAVFCNHPAPPVASDIGVWLSLNQPLLLYANLVQGSQTTSVATPANLPRGIPISLQAVVLVRGQLEVSTPVVVVSH